MGTDVKHILMRYPREENKLVPTYSLSNIFSERRISYINEFQIFISYFNSIPNYINEIKIDCKKANKWFALHYKEEIKESHFSKMCLNGCPKAELVDILYLLFEDLLIAFDTNNSKVKFLFRETDISRVNEIISGIMRFKVKKSNAPEISLLVNNSLGMEIKVMKVSKPKLSIDDNYNADFKDIHQTILKRLSKKNDKGLVLLHGKPGTGKTSYIRFLISSVKKAVIFLPPNMASAITNPELISILIDNPNSIFVIEDAENIVVDREKDGRSPVSALLNISDGLLSDCLNVQIICSFNTDLSKIDSALMRKGRLIAKYEFRELAVEKAQQLSNKLGFKSIIDKPTNLTAIYNQEEMDFQQSRRRNSVGF